MQQTPHFPRRDIHTAQIEQCYRQVPISLVVNLVNGLFLLVVLWEPLDKIVLLCWFLVLIAVTVARYLTLRAFREAVSAAVLDVRVWQRKFVIGTCATGVVWGTSGVLLFHPSSFPYQVFLAFVLGGMVAGAVPLLSAIGHAYRCFAIPVFVPIGIQMLSVGDRIHLIMGLMIAVFGIAMLATSAKVKGLYRDAEILRRRLLSSIEARHALEHMVHLDPLTEIANRRLFEEELRKEWGRAEREEAALAVVTADIDHFKEYNDLYGHPAGDNCLVQVGQTMQHALSRPGDMVARIGGEEFAFLLPQTTLSGAMTVIEHVRSRVLALNLPHDASPVAKQVTLSFGVASSEDESISSPGDLLRASDAALYEAKRRGRHQIAAANG